MEFDLKICRNMSRISVFYGINFHPVWHYTPPPSSSCIHQPHAVPGMQILRSRVMYVYSYMYIVPHLDVYRPMYYINDKLKSCLQCKRLHQRIFVFVQFKLISIACIKDLHSQNQQKNYKLQFSDLQRKKNI